MHNNPLILFDRYGLFAEQDTPYTDIYAPNPYRYRSRAEMVEVGFNVVWDTILSNPYVYGPLQAMGGLTEAGVGPGMALYSGGFAGPLGWPIMAHGMDHYVAGMNTAFSGFPKQTMTSQLLQQTGISQQHANLIDNAISTFATMGGGAMLRSAPPVGGYRGMMMPPSTPPPSGLGKTTAQMTTEISEFYKPFTKQYYRENLARFTGISPSGSSMHAHHVFPQKYAKDFLARNINIHEPKYLTWWEATSHRMNAKQYNLEWREFLRQIPPPTKTQILEQGKIMMNKHGINVNF